MSLISQAIIAAPSNISSTKNTKQLSLEQRLTLLEKKQKSRPIDPVLALPQANYRPKYNTAGVYNQDLTLLQMRQKFNKKMRKNRIKPMPYPHIELGGSVIGVASMNKPPMAPPLNGRSQSDINLAGANIDMNAEIINALMGNLRISYDPRPPERISTETITTRPVNSNIFLNTAFLTLGDLNRSPVYLSMGQLFLPFGEYGSSLLTAPLPARLGRMKQRPILLGFEPKFLPGFNASLFTFKGDAYVGNNSGVVDNGGGNISYTLTHSLFSLTTAGSFISNIADAGGMQNTGSSTIVTDAGEDADNNFLDEEDEGEDTVFNFRGFGIQGGEDLLHRVPALDARARLKLKNVPLSFYAEYLRPTTAFAPEDVAFSYDDGETMLGATPSAWNAEGSWNFTVFNNPSAFTIGYGHSSQALTFNLPQSTRGLTLKTTIKKVVTCSLGYQYDMAYPVGSFATGEGLEAKANKFVGTRTKTLTLQVNAKF